MSKIKQSLPEDFSVLTGEELEPEKQLKEIDFIVYQLGVLAKEIALAEILDTENTETIRQAIKALQNKLKLDEQLIQEGF